MRGAHGLSEQMKTVRCPTSGDVSFLLPYEQYRGLEVWVTAVFKREPQETHQLFDQSIAESLKKGRGIR